MKGLRRFKDRLKKDLEEPEFRKAFEEEEIFAQVAIQIAKIRKKEGLSQATVAKKLHTTQQTVSRLENAGNESYTLKTLAKLAQIFHRKLEIKFS